MACVPLFCHMVPVQEANEYGPVIGGVRLLIGAFLLFRSQVLRSGYHFSVKASIVDGVHSLVSYCTVYHYSVSLIFQLLGFY